MRTYCHVVLKLVLGIVTVSLAEILTNFDSSDEAGNANNLDPKTEIAILKTNQSLRVTCPFTGDDPCECSVIFDPDGTRRFSVTCRDFNQSDVFPAMMDKLRNYKPTDLRTLFLHRCKIRLPIEGLFEHLPFQNVQVTDSEIKVIKENDSRSPEQYRPLFGGLEESLIGIKFHNCTMRGFQWKGCSMGTFPKLNKFSLTLSAIDVIPKEFFCCSYIYIQEVYLFGNKFERLEEGTLSRAKNLRLVILNDNQIYLLSRNFFPYPANSMEEIHLRNNMIAALPSDLFAEMSSLRYVDLSNNKLEHLPSSLWEPIWSNLLDVYLQGNSVACDCTLQWLTSYETSKLSPEFKAQRFLRGSCSAQNNNSVITLALEDIDSLQLPTCA